MQVVIKYECFISFLYMTDFILFIIRNFHGNYIPQDFICSNSDLKEKQTTWPHEMTS